MIGTTQAPPLDTDLGSIKTDMPLIKDQEYYDFRVEKAEVKPTSTPGGKMVSLDYVTITPTRSMEGEELGPGVHMFDNVNVVPTGKATMEMVQRNVASLVKCFGLVKEKGFDWKQFGATPGEQIAAVERWAPQLLGKIGRIKVGYEPAGISPKNQKAYRAKNTVALYVPAR